MSDDLERRLRDSLHAAPLPGAPDTVRETLASLPGSEPPSARDRRVSAALLAAAVVVVSLVGFAGLVGVARGPASGTLTPGPSLSSAATIAGPTPSPSTPTPPTSPGPTSPPSTYAQTVAFWDGWHGLVGATTDQPDGSSSGQVLSTTDGGRTWSAALTTPATVVEVAVTGASDAWALTGCPDNPPCQGRLYHSGDGGQTWTSAATDLSWVTFAGPRDGWGVVGASTSTAPNQTELRRTTDGGRTWTTQPSPCAGSAVGPLRTVAFRSATAGLAVCALTAGAGGELHAVLATGDGGVHWSVRASTGDPPGTAPIGTIPYGGYITGIVLAPEGTAWITGGRMVPLASRDNGATWTPLALGDAAANLVYAAWPLDALTGAAVMWAPDRQATLLEVTADGGNTWTERASWPVYGVSAGPSPGPTSAAACTESQLAISLTNSGGGLGTVGGYIRFHNASGEPCSLKGWPTVVGVTAAGTSTAATHADLLLGTPPITGTPAVILAPGDDAFAAYAGGDNPVGSAATCPPPYRTLRVTAPGGTRPVSLPAFNAWLGQDLPACAGLMTTMVVAGSGMPFLQPLRP